MNENESNCLFSISLRRNAHLPLKETPAAAGVFSIKCLWFSYLGQAHGLWTSKEIIETIIESTKTMKETTETMKEPLANDERIFN